ncbi:exopolysaccharide biosynthesis protein [Xanthobacteraceae bacterium A53D]
MDHRPPRTSELLAAVLAAHTAPRVSVGELLDALRNRAFGISFLLFGLPNCIPMPPGIPVVCGIIIALIGLQMAIGRQELWLPQVITKRTFSRSVLETIITRSQRWIMRLEHWSQPRLEMFSGPTARRAVGVVMVMLGLVLLLPIPFFGNIPPGIAVCILGLGLVERDGGVILVGFFVAALASALLIGMTWALWQGAAAIL